MLSLALNYFKKNARKSGVGHGQFDAGVNGLKVAAFYALKSLLNPCYKLQDCMGKGNR